MSVSAFPYGAVAGGGMTSDSTDVTVGQYCPKTCIYYGYHDGLNFGSLSQSTLHGETVFHVYDAANGSGAFTIQLTGNGDLGAGWFDRLEVEDSAGTHTIYEADASHSTNSTSYDQWTWSSISSPDWWFETSQVRTVTMWR